MGEWPYVEPAHVAKNRDDMSRPAAKRAKTPTIALSVPEVSIVTIPSKRFPRSARARQLLTVVPCLSKKNVLATPLTGCGCKEVYRFSLYYLSLLLLYLFLFCSSISTFCSFKKCFSFFFI